MSDRSEPDEERRGRMCYACGVANERGLAMHFVRADGRTVCEYAPAAYQQGFPGRLHGGIVATMIDEAMGWAVYHAGIWGATARLSVRYRRPVPLEPALRIEAWIVSDRRRLIELRAEVRSSEGVLLAEGEGSFMRLDERISDELTGLAREAGRDDAPESVV